MAQATRRIWDISVPLYSGMPVYPGDPAVSFTSAASLEAGDGANVTRLDLGSHSGTHVDAPRHFLPTGRGVDELPWEALLGPGRLVQAPAGAEISADFVQGLGLARGDRLLLRTRPFGEPPAESFPAAWPALTREAAEWLAARGVALVGVDAPSVDAFGAAEPHVHRALLGAGVVPLEGLDLSAPPEGEYELICLPLRLRGADGSPCRAVLVG
ncbi:MAG TPA: cyclase family protein [Armatimonadota bacterium]|jgi:arylformamidase